VHAVLAMAGSEDAYVRSSSPSSPPPLLPLPPDTSAERCFPSTQTGKLYLSTTFLTFTSLDRRSCRLTLPLATIRRVEKLAPGQEGTAPGAFALGLTLFHGLRIVRSLSPSRARSRRARRSLTARNGSSTQILQLNSLRPTNDQFCAQLRVRLKASLPLMKALKPFAQTFFSEWFLSPDRALDRGRERDGDGATPATTPSVAPVGELISFDDGAASDNKGKGKEVDTAHEPWTTEWGTEGGKFHAGLCVSSSLFSFTLSRARVRADPDPERARSGMIFKFPGDPRKLRERSKMKLWRSFLTRASPPSRSHSSRVALDRALTLSPRRARRRVRPQPHPDPVPVLHAPRPRRPAQPPAGRDLGAHVRQHVPAPRQPGPVRPDPARPRGEEVVEHRRHREGLAPLVRRLALSRPGLSTLADALGEQG